MILRSSGHIKQFILVEQYLVPVVRLNPIEEILIFVLTEQFISIGIQLNKF